LKLRKKWPTIAQSPPGLATDNEKGDPDMEWMLMPLKRYADFSGRSRRMEFWMWQVFKFLVGIAFYILLFALAGTALMTSGGDPSGLVAAGGAVLIIFLLMMIFGLAIIIPDIAVAVRRLHDTNRSGWWFLAPFAPYLLVILGGVMAASTPDAPGVGGILVLLGMVGVLGLGLTLLVFYFLEGTRGPNQYGPDPKGAAPEKVFA
jgi:uncharacterized membrane protein YhaH (DUF805 family)